MNIFNALFKKKTGRGTTLIEILVASSVLLLTISIVYTAWSSCVTNFNILSSHVDARQEVRKSASILTRDIMNACYAYPGTNATIEGVDYSVPRQGQSGQHLLLAIPMDETAEKYQIIGYYLREDTTAPDFGGKKSYDLGRYENQGPNGEGNPAGTAGYPVTVNLTNLDGGSTRCVAKYIDKESFIFKMGDPGTYLTISPLARKQERYNQRPVEVQMFVTVNMRNQ